MEVFVKSFTTYRTIKKATTISFSLVVDSMDADTSTVTVAGHQIGREDIGNWLVADGAVYYISAVKPDSDRTILTLRSPLDAFSRPLRLGSQPEGQSIGGFIAAQMVQHWVSCDDPVFAVPYLEVSSSDTSKYIQPDLDQAGCYLLPTYCRLIRRSYRVIVQFSDARGKLLCKISRTPTVHRKISFADGCSKLAVVDYSNSGLSKLTVICTLGDGDTQESTWYLSDVGEISQTVPDRRAHGGWGVIGVNGEANVEPKVVETFAKNNTSHKLEFWSKLNLNVQDVCTFQVYDESLSSHISYKRKSEGDNRFYYKSGELATTATEKMRGAMI